MRSSINPADSGLQFSVHALCIIFSVTAEGISLRTANTQFGGFKEMAGRMMQSYFSLSKYIIMHKALENIKLDM